MYISWFDQELPNPENIFIVFLGLLEMFEIALPFFLVL